MKKTVIKPIIQILFLLVGTIALLCMVFVPKVHKTSNAYTIMSPSLYEEDARQGLEFAYSILGLGIWKGEDVYDWFRQGEACADDTPYANNGFVNGEALLPSYVDGGIDSIVEGGGYITNKFRGYWGPDELDYYGINRSEILHFGDDGDMFEFELVAVTVLYDQYAYEAYLDMQMPLYYIPVGLETEDGDISEFEDRGSPYIDVGYTLDDNAQAIQDAYHLGDWGDPSVRLWGRHVEIAFTFACENSDWNYGVNVEPDPAKEATISVSGGYARWDLYPDVEEYGKYHGLYSTSYINTAVLGNGGTIAVREEGSNSCDETLVGYAQLEQSLIGHPLNAWKKVINTNYTPRNVSWQYYPKALAFADRGFENTYMNDSIIVPTADGEPWMEDISSPDYFDIYDDWSDSVFWIPSEGESELWGTSGWTRSSQGLQTDPIRGDSHYEDYVNICFHLNMSNWVDTMLGNVTPPTVTEINITLDDGGNFGGQGTVTVKYNQPWPSVRIPKRTGYYFYGYYREIPSELLYPERDYIYDEDGRPCYDTVNNSNLPADDTLHAAWLVDNWNYHAASSFGGGNGSQSNPYNISSAAQLAKLAKDIQESTDLHTGEYFIQTADIDLQSHPWYGIGQFTGSYDGQLYQIKNIHTNSNANAGLFNIIKSATIKNIIIASGDLSATDGSAAGIACQVYGTGNTIENCSNNAKLSSNYGKPAGGIVGNARGAEIKIVSCKNFGNIQLSYDNYMDGSAGGIVGCAYTYAGVKCSITIDKCIVSATIYGGRHAGAMVGSVDDATLKITESAGFGQLSNSTNSSGSLTSSNPPGVGIVGSAKNTKIEMVACSFVGSISAASTTNNPFCGNGRTNVTLTACYVSAGTIKQYTSYSDWAQYFGLVSNLNSNLPLQKALFFIAGVSPKKHADIMSTFSSANGWSAV